MSIFHHFCVRSTQHECAARSPLQPVSRAAFERKKTEFRFKPEDSHACLKEPVQSLNVFQRTRKWRPFLGEIFGILEKVE